MSPSLLLAAVVVGLACCVSAEFIFPGEPDGENGRSVPSRNHNDASSHTIPLGGGLLHTSGFYFNASVGGQRLMLNVDTSYSSLIIPKLGCVGCRVGDTRYDPAKSSSTAVIGCSDATCDAKLNQCHSEHCFECSSKGNCCVKGTQNCAFNMFYGDGSSGNGTMYADNLEIAGLKANVLFGAMHEESHNFELPYADGVMGFAFQKGACHPACIPPVMDSVVNQTGIGDVFTMCVSRFGGTLVLGAADESLATRSYQYVALAPVAEDNRFIVPAQSEWKVGDRTLSVPGITAAMWSAGTSDIGVSKTTFLALLSHVMEHYCHIDGLCSMTSWFRPQRCAAIPDESVSQMPNITMGLSRGVSITLTPDDYLIKYRVVGGKMNRCVAFIATDGLAEKGIGLLLGATVMRRYAVVYDRAQKRIGLAPANPEKCGPKTGSDLGMPGLGTDGDEAILTANSSTVQGVDPLGTNTDIGKRLLQAEKCRAEETCSGCAAQANCSYGYQSGRCVPIDEAGKMPYPYCKGILCACIAVGPSGWYLGVAVGVMLGVAIAAVIGLVYRKRQRRNQYQMVQQYEEQDLETF